MLLGSSGSPFHAVLVGSNDIPAAISLMDRTHQSPRLTTILHPRKTQMDPKIGLGLRPALRFNRSELLEWIDSGCPRVDTKGGGR